jgi:hypothetical protein
MRGPRIFNPNAITMLSLMEGSTERAFWAAEVQRQTGVTRPTAQKYFKLFYELELVREVMEDSFSLKNPARKRYELTPQGVFLIRLHKEST